MYKEKKLEKCNHKKVHRKNGDDDERRRKRKKKKFFYVSAVCQFFIIFLIFAERNLYTHLKNENFD